MRASFDDDATPLLATCGSPSADSVCGVKKPTVEQRRTEILQATCEVVIERGFAGTRINDVAKRLGVSSSLLHYHFDSKEQLLSEAFAYYARQDLSETLTEIEAAPTAVEQLDRAINNYVPEGSGDVEWMLWIDGWGEALRNPMMRKISQELDEQSVDLLQRVIDHGCETGEFACPHPRASATRLTALVDGLAVQFAAHDGIMTRAEFIDHVRSAAAAEVGVSFADFGSALPKASFGRPAVATESALRQLVQRYADAVTRHDTDAFAGTWALDAEWHLPNDSFSGRDDIVDGYAALRNRFEWMVQTAPLMLFETDEFHGVARGRVTMEERYKRKNGKPGHLLGIYTDRYERLRGEWVFGERRLEVIEAS
jgi:AcrR family transcriptional regulator